MKLSETRTSLRLIILIVALFAATTASWALYTPNQCQGNLRPYPAPERAVAYPDSLKPIFINHVGRHGSRYPAGSNSALNMLNALNRADSLGTITPLGRQYRQLIQEIVKRSDGRWGALDSLGMAEHRGIARRLAQNYPSLLRNARIEAIATHSPRAIMSMYSFTHELSELGKNVEISTCSGKKFSPLLRPYDTDTAYRSYFKGQSWKPIYDSFVATHCPTPVVRLLGKDYPYTGDERQQLSIIEFYNIAGLEAMSMDNDWEPYFTLAEYNALWSCWNVRMYLQRVANGLTDVPARIIAPLVRELVRSGDSAVAGRSRVKMKLRFAHGETTMPLYSLLRLSGNDVVTSDWDKVATVWKSFDVTPMATNLQLIFFKGPSGTVWVRCDVDERPVPLIHGRSDLYVTWHDARAYMLQCCQEH